MNSNIGITRDAIRVKAISNYFDFIVEVFLPEEKIVYDEEKLERYLGITEKIDNMDKFFWLMADNYIHPDDLEKVDLFRDKDIDRRSLNNKSCVDTEFRIKLKGGSYIWISVIISEVFDDNNNLEYVIMMVKNINEKKLIELECTQLARKDGMTRLNNKVYMQNLVEEELDIKSRDAAAMVIIDIDDFKTINDNFGHIVGDHVIIAVANKLLENTRESDYVGRVGGDEFLLYLKGISEVDKLKNKMDKLIKNMDFVYEEDGVKVPVHCSMGATVSEVSDTEFNSIYRKADKALYKAKDAGKNRYVIYEK